MYQIIASMPMKNTLELLRLSDRKVMYFKGTGFQDFKKLKRGLVVDLVVVNQQYVIKKVA